MYTYDILVTRIFLCTLCTLTLSYMHLSVCYAHTLILYIILYTYTHPIYIDGGAATEHLEPAGVHGFAYRVS